MHRSREELVSALGAGIADRTARIGVLGLGYAGLPLAVAFASAGFSVTGVDLDQEKCDAVGQGRSYIADVRDSAIARLVTTGRLRAVTTLRSAGDINVLVVCVPTPLSKTKEPDLSQVLGAIKSAKSHFRRGMLMILESTTYPGTTEEVVKPIVEECDMEVGADFFLAFSPERIDPGNLDWGTREVPKVVGGATRDCLSLATALYETIIETVVPVSSPRTAEFVKLLENSFRAVNIALANEMAAIAERVGVDIWEAIEAAATKPYGFMPFYPGPGTGGHCIPIDPVYLSWKAREIGAEARFVDLAGRLNAAMPQHVVGLVSDALGEVGMAVESASILLMGVAYKRDVADYRESASLVVMDLLLQSGAQVSYHDPFVPRIELLHRQSSLRMESVPYSADRVAAADCVVVLTDHSGIDYEALASCARLVVDTRNAVRKPTRNVVKLGSPQRHPGAPPGRAAARDLDG
jgi:UDP-N-acetyl-D-glucosamine dehydrogenase